jgi:hypothetical protein
MSIIKKKNDKHWQGYSRGQKGDPYTVLVGATTMEISVQVLQETKNRTII